MKPMKFDAGTSTRLLADLISDIDPTGSTVELRVDDTWYPATWLDDPVAITKNGRPAWTQTARTTGYFAGPDVASPGAAVVLALGAHEYEARVTSGQDVLTDDMAPIFVK